jgi:hypothetical protein
MRYFLLALIFGITVARADLFSTPAPLTPAQSAANSIIAIIQSVIKSAPGRLNTAQKLLWNNPNAAPCDIIIAMGTNAQQAITTAASAVTFLNSVESGIASVPSHAGYTVSAVGDGSMSCSTPSPSPTPGP